MNNLTLTVAVAVAGLVLVVISLTTWVFGARTSASSVSRSRSRSRCRTLPLSTPEKSTGARNSGRLQRHMHRHHNSPLHPPSSPPEVIKTLRTLCDRVVRVAATKQKKGPGPGHGREERRDDDTGDALLAMGEIYRTGSFPHFAPHDEAAEACFKTCSVWFGGRIAALGQVKHMECLESPVAQVDRDGTVLPEEYARRAISAVHTRRRTRACTGTSTYSSRPKMALLPERVMTTTPATPATRTQGGRHTTTPTQTLPWIDPEPHPDPDPDPDHHVEDIEHQLFIMTMLEQQQLRQIPTTTVLVREDAQNVHDHGVTSAVASNLRAMAKCPVDEADRTNDTTEEVLQNVRACPDLSEADKDRAAQVLDGLNDRIRHSMYGVTEREALATVWTTIQASPYRAELVETLGKQLASGVEYGSVVCSSGKIARIVGTLDGVHNEATARPMNVVREEIAGMAVVVRNEVEKEWAVSHRPNDDDSAEEEMRERLKRRAHDEYVRRLGQSEAIVMPLVEEFCSGF